LADEKVPAGEEKDAAPSGPKRILGLPLPQFILVALNALVMVGGLGFIAWASLIYKKPAITNEQVVKEITNKAKSSSAQEEGTFFEPYPEMTITLKGLQGGKNHYATVEVSLLCASQRCIDRVKANKAKVEDAIQSSLSARSYEELSSLEVKFRVKHEIAGRVNAFLDDAPVKDVLFTSFLVQ
jgi:flagellar FliL protein